MFCGNNEVTKYIKFEAVLGAFVPLGRQVPHNTNATVIKTLIL